MDNTYSEKQIYILRLILDILNVLRKMTFEEWWINAKDAPLPHKGSMFPFEYKCEDSLAIFNAVSLKVRKEILRITDVREILNKKKNTRNYHLNVDILNKIKKITFFMMQSCILVHEWLNIVSVIRNIEYKKRGLPYKDMSVLHKNAIEPYEHIVNRDKEIRSINVELNNMGYQYKEFKKRESEPSDEDLNSRRKIAMSNLITINEPLIYTLMDYVFDSLNTPMIMPLKYSEKIVDKLRESNCKAIIQERYNLYALEHPNASNWVFDSNCSVRKMLPGNFDILTITKGGGLRLNLSKSQIENLYYNLYIKKYIAFDTDIYDFAYMLTGKPGQNRNTYKKIMWTHTHQSLSFLVGMLKKPDWGGWTTVCELFDSSKPLNNKTLSSLYNNEVKAQKKKAIWLEFEEIISKIKKMEIVK